MGVLAAPQKQLALESPSSDRWVFIFTFAVATTVRSLDKTPLLLSPPIVHCAFCFELLGVVFCVDFDPFFSSFFPSWVFFLY
jgi:hypothetical protein